MHGWFGAEVEAASALPARWSSGARRSDGRCFGEEPRRLPTGRAAPCPGRADVTSAMTQRREVASHTIGGR